MNRRDFIAALSGVGLAQWLEPGAKAQPETRSLQQLAGQKGLLFGSCLALKYCVWAPAYQ